VRLNGHVVKELGTKADPKRDRITVDGRAIHTTAPPPICILLNKPAGVVTTLSDPHGRPTVRDLLKGIHARVFPVGRLDYHSTGLLLLTNDGELALRLTHPRYGVRKTYRVKVKGEAGESALRRLREGVRLPEGRTAPAEVHVVGTSERKAWLEITVAEGKRRQIRRMCEAVGLLVEKLERTRIGPLKLGSLPRGRYRQLTPQEVAKLRAAVGMGR
jgi:pseudouridine synthase